MSNNWNLRFVHIPTNQARALLCASFRIACFLCHRPCAVLMGFGRFSIGAMLAFQPMTAGILLISIGMIQRIRFIGTVAVTTLTGIGCIATAGAGRWNYGRYAGMGMAFLRDHRNWFCFGVATITIVGQNSFFSSCGLFCNHCTAKYMGLHIHFGCATLSAPVPMIVIIIILCTQSGNTMPTYSAIMRLPRFTFHADPVIAAIAVAHRLTAGLAQAAVAAELRAPLTDATGRTGQGTVLTDSATVGTQGHAVTAVIAVFTHPVGAVVAGTAVRAEDIYAVLAPAAVRAHSCTVRTAISAFKADVCTVLAGSTSLAVRTAVLTFAALRTEISACAVQAGIAVGAKVGAVLADIAAEGTHPGTLAAGIANITEPKSAIAVLAFAAVRAYLTALFTYHSADEADDATLVAHAAALSADVGTVGTQAAALTVASVAAEAVGAVVNVGANPLGAVPAVFTVPTPFVSTFQTNLAALLADQCAVATFSTGITESVHTFVAFATVRAEIL